MCDEFQQWTTRLCLNAEIGFEPLLVLFPSEPCAPSAVDGMYEAEAEAARQLSFTIGLIDHEALVGDENVQAAISANERFAKPQKALYRGWMMPIKAYASLYETLKSKNIHLMTTPQAYEFCHHLPSSYELIEGLTPATLWFECDGKPDWEGLFARLAQFGHNSLVLKDYVKSQKHYWHEACYIPRASDKETVKKVVQKFLELQGEDLAGGLVFRLFEQYKSLGNHEISGMPLSIEYRLFVLQGRPLLLCPYWDDGEYIGEAPELSVFEDLLAKIESPFYTADMALREDGQWRLVELGDGQVAGLPDSCTAADFYLALSKFLLE